MLGDPAQTLPFHIHGAACLEYSKLRGVQKVTVHMKDKATGIEIHEKKAEK